MECEQGAVEAALLMNSCRRLDMREIDDRTWWLAPEHEPELRRRQRDRDIIKTRARERMQQQSKEREIER